MKVGVVFPQTEIGADPVAVRDYAQAAEDLGYAHLIVFDHVIGADAEKHEGWTGGYTTKDMFHEPFVLFGYMAAITKRMELVTAVLILGQRQTALVAKQAAEADVLSGGRVRLGIGVGWNHVEYEALGESFQTGRIHCLQRRSCGGSAALPTDGSPSSSPTTRGERPSPRSRAMHGKRGAIHTP